MKNLRIFMAISTVFSIFSCSDYLDVNKNENKPLYDQLPLSSLLSAAENACYTEQAQNMNDTGNVYTNAWGGNVSQYGNVLPNEFTLQMPSNYASSTAIWNTQYPNINNFSRILTRTNVTGINDRYFAASLICRAHYMQYIVDLFGDCPFTEAFKGNFDGTGLSPKYNDDQYIYRLLIADLEKAKALILAANPNAEDIAASDPMLAGDMNKWYDFADTVELRMLLRMSNNTGAVATWRDAKLLTLQADAIAAPGGTGGYVTTPVSINPGYNISTNDTLNPFYAQNGVGTDGQTPSGNYNFYCPTGHAFKCFTTYATYAACPSPSTVNVGSLNYPNVADARFLRLRKSGSSSGTKTVTQGSNIADVYASTATGSNAYRITGTGLWNPYNVITATVLTDYGTAKGYVMTLQESLFLQAEAGLRGYAGFTPVSGLVAYNAGIDESFLYLGIAASSPAYKTAIANKIGYSATAAGASPAQKLQGLMYQKWVALFGIHGIESFIDYTRTGYPVNPLPIGTGIIHTNKVNRFVYPNSEIIANTSNVPAVSEDDCFTINSKSPFWLQGNPVLGN